VGQELSGTKVLQPLNFMRDAKEIELAWHG
jgi:hypothetical protein